jgi:nucleoside-diphosphate-sugar epimerase
MDSALVTGVAGFVGSNLANNLLSKGVTVRGIDNFATGRRANVEWLSDNSAFECIEGDIRDKADVERAVDGVDCVFHQAAVPSVPRSIEQPTVTTSANCVGTTNVLVAARDAGVDKVVSASSSSVYGSGGTLPRTESDPTSPESPYALSKYWTERLTVQFGELYDIDTVALRYFNVFGPRQDPNSEYSAVIPTFIDRMTAGKRPVIYGDGEQSRDFTYIANVVQANYKAAMSDCNASVFNVGAGGRTTVNSLVDQLNDILGTDIEPKYESERAGDVRHSDADISKARNLLDYEVVVGFEEGLERTVDSMRS